MDSKFDFQIINLFGERSGERATRPGLPNVGPGVRSAASLVFSEICKASGPEKADRSHREKMGCPRGIRRGIASPKAWDLRFVQ